MHEMKQRNDRSHLVVVGEAGAEIHGQQAAGRSDFELPYSE